MNTIILLAVLAVGANNDRLIQALIQVESGGDCNAVGDSGQAIGCLQIHPIMVKEVNRILGKDKYTLQDRYSRAKSIEMCNIYLNRVGGNDEKKSRCWNGGYSGHQKKATEKYWLKVKRELSKNS